VEKIEEKMVEMTNNPWEPWYDRCLPPNQKKKRGKKNRMKKKRGKRKTRGVEKKGWKKKNRRGEKTKRTTQEKW